MIHITNKSLAVELGLAKEYIEDGQKESALILLGTLERLIEGAFEELATEEPQETQHLIGFEYPTENGEELEESEE